MQKLEKLLVLPRKPSSFDCSQGYKAEVILIMTEEQKSRIHLLRERGLGYIRVAQALGISENTVKSYCRRNHIKLGTRVVSSGKINSSCAYCGQEIQQIPKRKKRKFCSDECRKAYWQANVAKIKRNSAVRNVCPVCGKVFKDYVQKNRKYCSHECYIVGRYKGGVQA